MDESSSDQTVSPPEHSDPHATSPLESWHRAHGASLATWGDSLLPADYGDPRAELLALEHGCAVLDLASYEVVDLVGADRHRFLNGLVTVAVKGLEPGQGLYGLVTEAKGHVLADVLVTACEDRLRLMLPRGRGCVVAKHFEHYIVADRVSLEVATPVSLLWLGGPHLGEVLASRGAELPGAPFAGGWLERDGERLAMVRDSRVDEPAVLLELPEREAPDLVESLACETGVEPVGYRAWDAWRVRVGLPVWGADFDASCLPQETGLDEVVDFEKGCYLGQEVIARLHYRGQAPRLLRRLRAPRGALPTGAEILFEGRPAGVVCTTTDSVLDRAPSALCRLQRRAAEPGSVVQVSGTEATVEEL